MATHLVLIRHGNTTSNGLHSNPVMSGWTDLPLTNIGQQQVQSLRERLLREAPFHAIYSSPLQRARQTADGIEVTSRSPVQLLEDLRELNCGAVDGLSISHVREVFADLWEANLLQDDPHFRWPDGETYQELRSRSIRALDEIAARHPSQRVLVVTHCGLISQVAGAIHGVSPARWESYRVENASLTETVWFGSTGRFLSFNDTSHLPTTAKTVASNLELAAV